MEYRGINRDGIINRTLVSSGVNKSLNLSAMAMVILGFLFVSDLKMKFMYNERISRQWLVQVDNFNKSSGSKFSSLSSHVSN